MSGWITGYQSPTPSGKTMAGIDRYGKLAVTAALAGSAATVSAGFESNDWQVDRKYISTWSGHGLLPYVSQGLPSSLSGEYVNIDSNVSVQQFMKAMPAADLVAIQQIFDLAIKSFKSSKSSPHPSFEVGMEDENPVLFLGLDTQDMDLDEQLRREVRMREVIHSDPRLAAAKNYLIINVY